MNRLYRLSYRYLPIVIKKISLLSMIYAYQEVFAKRNFLQCASSTSQYLNSLSGLSSNVIVIKSNGDVIGFAYCFSDNYLISTNLEIAESKHHKITYEYYINDKRLNGSFKVIGTYENFVIVQAILSDVKPLPFDLIDQEQLEEVKIVEKKDFFSIHSGYFVGRDSGYGIISGKGQVGSLVLKNGKVVGIVSQVGRQSQVGFVRMVEWRHLGNILRDVKGEKVHLGVSVQKTQGQEGLSIVRISPHSFMRNQIMMGDIILKANGQQLRQAQALSRICLFQQKQVTLTVLREGKQLQINLKL